MGSELLLWCVLLDTTVESVNNPKREGKHSVLESYAVHCSMTKIICYLGQVIVFLSLQLFIHVGKRQALEKLFHQSKLHSGLRALYHEYGL